jgi:hypothetical protein
MVRLLAVAGCGRNDPGEKDTMPRAPQGEPSRPTAGPQASPISSELLEQTREKLDTRSRTDRLDRRARSVQVEMARELMRDARRRRAGRASRT